MHLEAHDVMGLSYSPAGLAGVLFFATIRIALPAQAAVYKAETSVLVDSDTVSIPTRRKALGAVAG